jgi:hypothetical protein
VSGSWKRIKEIKELVPPQWFVVNLFDTEAPLTTNGAMLKPFLGAFKKSVL